MRKKVHSRSSGQQAHIGNLLELKRHGKKNKIQACSPKGKKKLHSTVWTACPQHLAFPSNAYTRSPSKWTCLSHPCQALKEEPGRHTQKSPSWFYENCSIANNDQEGYSCRSWNSYSVQFTAQLSGNQLSISLLRQNKALCVPQQPMHNRKAEQAVSQKHLLLVCRLWSYSTPHNLEGIWNIWVSSEIKVEDRHINRTWVS